MENSGESDNLQKFETIILEEYRKMGLDYLPEYEVDQVSLNFQTSEPQPHPVTDYYIDEERVLHVHIQNSSLEEGVKFLLARITYDFKARFMNTSHRLSTFPAIYPMATVALSLAIIILYALEDFALSILLGPVFYIIITLPVLLLLTKMRAESQASYRKRVKGSLDKSSLYNERESADLTAHLLGNLSIHYIIEYIIFVPVVFLYVLLVLFVHS